MWRKSYIALAILQFLIFSVNAEAGHGHGRGGKHAAAAAAAAGAEESAGTYSVVAPGTIRPNSNYSVVASVHKGNTPCEFELGIIGPSLTGTMKILVEPNKSKMVTFEIPSIESGDYNLTAKGLSGIKFENTTSLNFEEFKPAVFIQTDKATYKPKDIINYRILYLDENSRPAKITDDIEITITDPATNLIKQLNDVKLTKGVYTSNLQLAEVVPLGSWCIKVQINGEEMANKCVDVANYVLPKYKVEIDTPSNVAISSGVMKATIRAMYTYGKPLVGKATVSVMPTYNFYNTDNVNYVAAKTIPIDGKGHVEFNFNKELKIPTEVSYAPPVQMTVVVTDALTGNEINATKTITLHKQTYKIEGVVTPSTFQTNEKIQYKIAVKNLDDTPVVNAKTPVVLIFEVPYYFHTQTSEAIKDKYVFPNTLNEMGIAVIDVQIPESNVTFFSVRAEYKDSTGYLPSLSKYNEVVKPTEQLELNMLTEKPKLGAPVKIEIKSNEDIPSYTCVVVAHGTIIQMINKDLPAGQQSHTFEIQTRLEMVPKSMVYVYYVVDDNLRHRELEIVLPKDFENQLEIKAPAQVKPGEKVDLQIETAPDSYVGLLGVDQSVLLLKSGNDLDRNAIFNKMESYKSYAPYRGLDYPGQQSGTVTMTNSHYVFRARRRIGCVPRQNPKIRCRIPTNVIMRKTQKVPAAVNDDNIEKNIDDGIAQTIQIRKEFPELWLFMNIENTSDGSFHYSAKIPDTITSWVITGFSMNENVGLGMTKEPTMINVFQPFFVSTNLPPFIKRGESIAIPVIIYNYMDKSQNVEVTMDNSDDDYDFTEATNEIDEATINEVKRTKRVTVDGNSGKTLSFMISAKKTGEISLKIRAVGQLAGDEIHQTLKVIPEGITKYENRATFINLIGKSEHTEDIPIELPKDFVSNSTYIELSAIGDLLGPTTNNLDKLVRMPYGCGEQNMVNFVPNILVTNYILTTKKNLTNVLQQAKKFMDIGYQRELTYKHDDGSYSAFGKSDKAGSTWLTAYVMRSFVQAKPYTDIDDKILNEGFGYLAKVQNKNGSFDEMGRLLDFSLHDSLALSSFVMLAFLESKEVSSQHADVVSNGIRYIEEESGKTSVMYSMAIALNVLKKVKSQNANELQRRLEELATNENQLKWWTPLPRTYEQTGRSVYWQESNPKEIETTAYIVQGLIEDEDDPNVKHNNYLDKVLPVIRWLIKNRNSNGGFSSTQDTVVGLQALIKFAQKTGSGDGEMSIDYVAHKDDNTDYKGTIQVNKQNALVLQSHVMPKNTNRVEYRAHGKGTALVQLAYNYNVDTKDQKPSFNVYTIVNESALPDQLEVDVVVDFVPLKEDADKVKDSNMAVLEIDLPSGYSADLDTFKNIEAIDRVKRIETKNADTVVVVYFDSLTTNDTKSIPVRATRVHAVAKQKPSAVRIYDYYETDRQASGYYNVKSSLCDICEGDDCGNGCPPKKSQ